MDLLADAWHAVLHALAVAGAMTWEILWALVLGFALSAVIAAVVRRESVARRLGGTGARSIALATGFGAASSSCSYAAVALGIVMAVLLGWQFTLAEFVGGPLMIIMIAVLYRVALRERLAREAREQADKGVAGSMEGHAAMDMSVGGDGSVARRLLTRRGFTSVSHVFVMEWAAVLRDIVVGLLVAGAVAAWVPTTFGEQFFVVDHPVVSAVWGPIVGPVVSVLSVACSIGKVPLAAVLWNGGISFGGVVAFIFADLIIIPILVIYRKYYGTAMMLTILGIFYAAMVLAGYAVEFAFGGLGLIPAERAARVAATGITWTD